MQKYLGIPSIVDNPLSFYAYFKQNVLQYLNGLSLNADSDMALKSQFLVKHPNHSDPAEPSHKEYPPSFYPRFREERRKLLLNALLRIFPP